MGYIEKTTFLDKEVYKLCCGNIEALVCPNDGMNIYRVCYRDTKVIDVDLERYKNGVTYGTPILYPTPNRVNNNIFTYEGKEYNAAMHGCVKNEPFEIIYFDESEDRVSLRGRLEFEKSAKLYELFPFESTLEIEITVFGNKIKYAYRVVNKSDGKLPFGFSIHPFFRNEEKQARIKVNAKNVMEMNEDKLPTGSCLTVNETRFDLSSPVLVSELDLDHVYTKVAQPTAVIYYSDFKVLLSTTKDFTHIVVFTPKEKPYFCMENQTCSTDAHNMYQRGFKEESGLIEVNSKESAHGAIEMEFKQ